MNVWLSQVSDQKLSHMLFNNNFLLKESNYSIINDLARWSRSDQ